MLLSVAPVHFLGGELLLLLELLLKIITTALEELISALRGLIIGALSAQAHHLGDHVGWSSNGAVQFFVRLLNLTLRANLCVLHMSLFVINDNDSNI